MKFYQAEVGSLWVRRFVSREDAPVVLSALTLVEYVGRLMYWCRDDKLSRRDVRRLVERLRRDIGPESSSRPFCAVAVPDRAYTEAEKLLLLHGSGTRIEANDGLHLAIVVCLRENDPNVTMVTSDRPMKAICEKLSIPFLDPESPIQDS